VTPSARDLLAVAGVLLAAVGILFVVDPQLGGLGVGEAAVLVIGVLALLHGLWLVRENWGPEVDQAPVPTPEEPRSPPVPGAEFDRTLGYRVHGDAGRPYRERITGRLRDVADDITERFEHEMEDITFSTRPSAGSIADSVRGVLSAETGFQRRVRTTVDRFAGHVGVADTPLPRLDDQPLPENTVGGGPEEEPTAAAETDDRREGLYSHTVRATTRWQGVKAIALVGIGVGIVSKRPGVLLGGIAGFGFAGYAQSGSAAPVELSAERRLSDDTPAPGETVEVTVEVRNTGERTLPDLRIVDGVPSALPVTRGSPRTGVALRPGKVARFSYTMAARRGDHEFDPITVLARDTTGGVEQEFTLEEETDLVCLPPMRPAAVAPLRDQGSGFAGQVRAGTGGGGTEFHATREYRHGDPLNRIDWNRTASTGELATLEFREHRLAKVLVVVDVREAARKGPPDASMTALDRSVYAAGRLFTALLDGGNRVGIATAGAGSLWLPPGGGDDHRARARELLAVDSAFDPFLDGGEFHPLPWLHRLRRRLGGDAQVVVVTPLSDDLGSVLPRWIEGYGFPVTVVSPDPTGDRTTGQRLARVERSLRLNEIRTRGIQAVDWAWEEPLDVALLRAEERWRA